jgi:hypothetical protein
MNSLPKEENGEFANHTAESRTTALPPKTKTSVRKRQLVKDSARNVIRALGTLVVDIVRWGRPQHSQDDLAKQVNEDNTTVLMTFPDATKAAAAICQLEVKMERMQLVTIDLSWNL